MPILSGKAIAERLLSTAKEKAAALSGRPGLSVVLVGDNPASKLYVDLKEKAAATVGLFFERSLLPASATEEEILARIHQLNERPEIHGIIVQLPLPRALNPDRLVSAIDPGKDADGFHPNTVEAFANGRLPVPPVFPRALLALALSAGVPLQGKQAVVFANSLLFGKVMGKALSNHGLEASVKLDAPDPNDEVLASADVIVTAKGVPEWLSLERVRPGAIVIDGGIARASEKTYGDVNRDSFEHRKDVFLSPVPGGVGPVTVAYLILRTIELAAERKSILET